jgi:hydroxysqualene synthase
VSGTLDTPSGKHAGTENFPVGSWLIRAELRPHVHAFYNFARTADDIADNPDLVPEEKVRRLARMGAVLQGDSGVDSPAATAMRGSLAATGVGPEHCLDLLRAFTMDATKLRYRDWDDLMVYCRYSASPVGRQVLDLHGESRETWAPNDALCNALQVINHLQDCAKDYRELNRVYIPEPMLAAAGITVAALGEDKANPALAGVISALARKNSELLEISRPFARGIRDGRLALEVDLIQTLADDLNTMLIHRDPLSQPVHHSKLDMAALFVKRFPSFALMRLKRPRAS